MTNEQLTARDMLMGMIIDVINDEANGENVHAARGWATITYHAHEMGLGNVAEFTSAQITRMVNEGKIAPRYD